MLRAPTFCASAAARVAEVPKSTLRSWRKFNGLFTRPPGGWHRYDFSELCAIRAVAIMTRAGIQADVAVKMAPDLATEFDSGRTGFFTIWRKETPEVAVRFDIDAIRESVEELL